MNKYWKGKEKCKGFTTMQWTNTKKKKKITKVLPLCNEQILKRKRKLQRFYHYAMNKYWKGKEKCKGFTTMQCTNTKKKEKHKGFTTLQWLHASLDSSWGGGVGTLKFRPNLAFIALNLSLQSQAKNSFILDYSHPSIRWYLYSASPKYSSTLLT